MDANSINQSWCTKCTAFRDSESFESNKSGKKKKLCNRHGKKRDQFDDWDTFEKQLCEWNHPVGHKYLFLVDSYPINVYSESKPPSRPQMYLQY